MLTSLLTYGWLLLQVIIGYNLVLPLVLFAAYLLLGRKKKTIVAAKPETDYAIIITAYEQTDSVPAAVASILKLNYSNYMVYVVADKCDVSGLQFSDSRVVVLRPEQTLASNTRSHFYAINRFQRPHEHLTIIDSDNLVHPNYLLELNLMFNQGFQAVQGVREAKNLDSTYACLDAARDIYYHFYDGEVLFGLGSSATLAGSGMAFNTELYRECLERLDITGAGFDKVLQYELVKRNQRIAFTPHAVVFDEKTAQANQLVNQRSRWINTWFRYFSFGFKLVGSGSWNQFLFGLILLRPPLFMFLIVSGICMVVNLWISPWIALIWFIAFMAFVSGFLIALNRSDTDPRIYRSLKNIPKFMYLQLVSLANARKANQKSVATRHASHVNIDDILPPKS